jgi:putative heme-binding domain-containing protein
VRRSKDQDPSSRETLNPKLQIGPRPSFAGLCLELALWFHLLCCAPALASAAAGSSQPESAQAAIAVEALSRLKGMDLEANPALKAAVLKVLDQVRGTPQFLEIVRDFKIKGQGREVTELAIKKPDESLSVEAMRIALAEQDSSFLKSFLVTSNAPNFVKLLGNTGEKQIVPLLLPMVEDQHEAFAARKSAVQSLARVQEGAAALLDLAQQEKLPESLKLTATLALNSAQWPSLKARAAELLPLPLGKNSLQLPSISELAQMKGDAAKGAEVFRREIVGCNKCHQVNGEGIDFGPNLSEIGGKLARDALYESILDPSAGISFGYEAWQLDLKNGDEVFGLIVSETANELALKVAGGILTRYPKSEILKRQKQTLSNMPAGLQQTMTKEELVDLVEYLVSLKSKSR